MSWIWARKNTWRFCWWWEIVSVHVPARFTPVPSQTSLHACLLSMGLTAAHSPLKTLFSLKKMKVIYREVTHTVITKLSPHNYMLRAGFVIQAFDPTSNSGRKPLSSPEPIRIWSVHYKPSGNGSSCFHTEFQRQESFCLPALLS